MILVLLLFLSDDSPTSLLSVDSPGRVIVDWQSSPGDLAGGQGGRVRGQQAQPGGSVTDLLHGPVSELIHPQEVSLDTSSVLIVVILERKYRCLWSRFFFGGRTQVSHKFRTILIKQIF